MAKKPNISNVASGYQSTTTINNNFENIRNAFDNTLSRDGSTPNSMLADLDMNGKAILNVGVNSNNPNSILTVGTADARYVNTAGDTMTGNLTVPVINATGFFLNGNPVLPTSLSYNGVVKETIIATSGQTVFNLSTISYTPTINNLSIYVDGIYQKPSNYTENSATQVTFSVGLHVGAVVDFVVLTINSLSGTADAVNLTYTAPGSGAVTRTVYSRLSDFLSIKDFNIVSDGATDQSTAIINVLNTLSSGGFRGWIHIPYNTKFDVATVYPAVPAGIVLDDQSSINWGQPPGYKNRFNMLYSGDTVSDDTQQVIGSNHHPSLMFLNMGTATSGAATSRYASILHAVGIDYNNDPVLGFLQQFNKQTSNNRWQVQWRLQTPYSVAIANPQPWVTATVYSANDYCISDSGKVYQTTAGGTSGGTAPTGTGTGINDGGVLWNYVQAALNIDGTVFYFDEDGNCQIIARSGTPQFRQQSGVKYHYFEVSSTTGDITWRDGSRSVNVLSVTDAAGLELGISQGPNRLILSGTGPNAPVNGYGRVDNSSVTNMSTMVPFVGRNRMIVSLRFENANTTLVHGTGTNNLTLKGATNITPPVGGFITFEYDSSFSARWFEVSRSF